MMSTSQRTTRQRTAIREVLANGEEFVTAAQLHDQLRQADHQVGIATVYRALQTMLEAGELDSIRTAGGEAAYRRCSAKHHHHLVCTNCGAAVEVVAEQVEHWAKEIGERYGYRNVGHEVELYGRCANCS
ncbi:MAG: Fur family transcriptional regulator [Arachnia sp.]